jgi:hypothetical protein
VSGVSHVIDWSLTYLDQFARGLSAWATAHHMPGWVAAGLLVAAAWMVGAKIHRAVMWVAVVAAAYVGWRILV